MEKTEGNKKTQFSNGNPPLEELRTLDTLIVCGANEFYDDYASSGYRLGINQSRFHIYTDQPAKIDFIVVIINMIDGWAEEASNDTDKKKGRELGQSGGSDLEMWFNKEKENLRNIPRLEVDYLERKFELKNVNPENQVITYWGNYLKNFSEHDAGNFHDDTKKYEYLNF